MQIKNIINFKIKTFVMLTYAQWHTFIFFLWGVGWIKLFT